MTNINWHSIDKVKPPVGALLLVTYCSFTCRDYAFAKLIDGKIYYAGSYSELTNELANCYSEPIENVELDVNGNPIYWCQIDFPLGDEQ